MLVWNDSFIFYPLMVLLVVFILSRTRDEGKMTGK